MSPHRHKLCRRSIADVAVRNRDVLLQLEMSTAGPSQSLYSMLRHDGGSPILILPGKGPPALSLISEDDYKG